MAVLVGGLTAADAKFVRNEQTPEALLKWADADSDGKLSATEYQAKLDQSAKHAPQRFKKADADKDGQLTLAELKVALESIPWWKLSRHTPEEWLTKMDKDKDGSLSEAEFKELDPHKNHYQAHFKKYDADKDSKLSLAEVKAFVGDETKE
jgi:Ca2+-binding EF-hand superfamily protein